MSDIPVPDPKRLPSSSDFPDTRYTLIRNLGTGDGLVWAQFFGTYYLPSIHFLLGRKLCKDEAAASDIVQVVLLRLADRRIPLNTEKGLFRAYLVTVLCNYFKDRTRHDKAAKRGGGAVHVPIGAPADSSNPSGPAVDPEDRNWISPHDSATELENFIRHEIFREYPAELNLDVEIFLERSKEPREATLDVLAKRYGRSITWVRDSYIRAKKWSVEFTRNHPEFF